MPKIKSHRATAKRIKKTATGKLLREHSYRNHFLEKKSASRKRAYGKKHPIDESRRKLIKRALGE